MQLIQLRRPLQRVVASSCRPSLATTPTSLSELFARLSVDGANAQVEGRRYASVKSQGAYRIPNKKTIAKKLGAKKSGDQYVIPGNILYKQRGTVWHPGENTHMGRDHTIHASVSGYVKYYRDPLRHPKRQYIGVVFNRDDKLPYSIGAPRKRKLGMVAVPRRTEAEEGDILGPSGIPRYVVRREGDDVMNLTLPNALKASAEASTDDAAASTTPADTEAAPAKPLSKQQQYEKEAYDRRRTRVFRLQDDYSYRETNWEIGRLVGPAGTVGGAARRGSRKSVLQQRRKQRNKYFTEVKVKAADRKVRRTEHMAVVARRTAIKEKERAELAEQEKAMREAAEKADRESLQKQT